MRVISILNFLIIKWVILSINISHSLTQNLPKIEMSVRENTQVRTQIGNLFSEVLKLTQQKPTEFKLISETRLFSVDKISGVVTVTSQLDRERICDDSLDKCSVELFVGTDVGYLDVKIFIEDVNDQYPKFPVIEKRVDINEDVKPQDGYFPLPRASDKDSAEFGIDRYTLESAAITSSVQNEGTEYNLNSIKKYFKLIQNMEDNHLVPKLMVTQPLDRETISKFVFNLVAHDRGALSASVLITVKVDDVNDNKPTWLNEPYTKTIDECSDKSYSTTDQEVFQLRAEDADDPLLPNGKVHFKISDQSADMAKLNQMFYISSNEYKLYVNKRALKNFNVRNISFSVLAIDGKGESSSTKIKLFIKDCNDHKPNIVFHSKYPQLLENTKGPHDNLPHISVTDSDRGDNSDFSCQLNDTKNFNLKTLNVKRMKDDSMVIYYKLATNENVEFDREKTPYVYVLISCTDRGSPHLYSRSVLMIVIVDQNDNAPQFYQKSYEFSVKENMDSGTHIGRIKAKDEDEGNNCQITYSLDPTGQNSFSITSSGSILTTKRFDRETKSLYKFAVIAQDKGKPPKNSTVEVIVRILDENDCDPIFKQNYNFDVEESYGNANISKILGKIEATDDDEGPNQEISYRIAPVSMVTNRHFQVLHNGQLRIHGIIDRESNDDMIVYVVAEDHGKPRRRSSTATVLVRILDLNDNRPDFKFPNHLQKTINVSVNTGEGDTVGEVKATDPDYLDNGTVTYEIVEGFSTNYFQLHSSGKLQLARRLDKKFGELPSRLTIRARDQGTPQLISSTTNLLLRYYDERKTPGLINQRRDHGSQDISPENLSILIALAVIVFVVFFVVLSILIYMYVRGRMVSNRGGNYKGSPGPANNQRIQRHLENNDEQILQGLVADGTLTRKLASDLESPNTAVCVYNDHENSYTHLSMTASRAPSYGYIPVFCRDTSTATGTTALPGNPYATYSPYGQRHCRLVTGKSFESADGDGKMESRYEQCMWGAGGPEESLHNEQVNMKTRTLQRGKLDERKFSQDRNLENVLKTGRDTYTPTMENPKNLDAGTLQTAHSLAFLNNLMRDTQSESSAKQSSDDNLSKKLTSQSKSNVSKLNTNYKSSPYVTSSFV